MNKEIFCVGNSPPPYSGRNICFIMLFDKLKKINFENITLHKIDLSKANNKTKLIFYIYKYFSYLKLYNFLIFSKKEMEIIISSNSSFGLLFDIILIIICNKKNYKFYIHHHNFSLLNKNLLNSIFFFISKKNNHIFLSKTVEKSFQNQYKMPNTLCLNNVYTINLKLNKKSALNKTIGFMSNLTEAKGVLVFLELVNHKMLRKFDFLLGGTCDDKQILKKINECQKYKNFQYYGEITNNENKENFYNQIDLFLFPSKYKNETQPLVILEAMSLNIPVLSSNIGAISDIINNENLLINDINDISQWKKKINQVFFNYDYYEKIIKEEFLKLKKLNFHEFNKLIQKINE